MFLGVLTCGTPCFRMALDGVLSHTYLLVAQKNVPPGGFEESDPWPDLGGGRRVRVAALRDQTVVTCPERTHWSWAPWEQTGGGLQPWD